MDASKKGTVRNIPIKLNADKKAFHAAKINLRSNSLRFAINLEPKKQNNMYTVTKTTGSNALLFANSMNLVGMKSFSYCVVAKFDILSNTLANSSGLSNISILSYAIIRTKHTNSTRQFPLVYNEFNSHSVEEGAVTKFIVDGMNLIHVCSQYPKYLTT